MPWKEVDRMSLKQEFVELAGKEGVNRSELCRRFGISRKTGYKWLSRYQEGGHEKLQDLNKKAEPRRIPLSISSV